MDRSLQTVAGLSTGGVTPCMPCSFGRLYHSGQRRAPCPRPSRSDRDCPLDTASARCLWHVGGTAGVNDDARACPRRRHSSGPPYHSLRPLDAGHRGQPGACFDLTSPGVREADANRQRLPGGLPALGFMLAAVGCSGPDGTPAATACAVGRCGCSPPSPISTLDTALFPYPAIARAYARTLYGYNLAGPPEQRTVPVPDIASSYQLSADQRTYTFTLRPGVRYAPRSTARSPPRTSSPPSSGSTTRRPRRRAAVRRPDRRSHSVWRWEGRPHLGPDRPRRPHPHHHPGPAGR